MTFTFSNFYNGKDFSAKGAKMSSSKKSSKKKRKMKKNLFLAHCKFRLKKFQVKLSGKVSENVRFET
jgi:hypothetical protein